jgi:hypothetical protein
MWHPTHSGSYWSDEHGMVGEPMMSKVGRVTAACRHHQSGVHSLAILSYNTADTNENQGSVVFKDS